MALGSDALRAETAKATIIETGDLLAMDTCVARSLTARDYESAEFWYLEIVTAGMAPTPVIREGLLAYSRKLLLPLGRLSEAELQMCLLASLNDRESKAAAREELEHITAARSAAQVQRQQYSDEWHSVDLSLPVDPRATPKAQYLRTLAFLFMTETQERFAPAPAGGVAHLADVEGLFLGLRRSAQQMGGNTEVVAQAVADWLTWRLCQEYRTMPAANPMAQPTTRPQNLGAPTTNDLGHDVDSVFSKLPTVATQIKRALGVESGVNREHIIQWFRVSDNLGPSISGAQWMVFTEHRCGLFTKKSFLVPEESKVFSREKIAFLGFGDSQHYQAQGFVGTSSSWTSVTLELVTGERYTRHVMLGSNEAQINRNLPVVNAGIRLLAEAGYPVGDGPGWNSQGGHTTSYGFGVIREI